ncbi:ubiquinol-cytochrome-c reductase complex subunit-domain-containing protein [Hyaloscypha finlandica]|nr:ubiquinol-cytochrome-c reductase complex subunit-domain-containing protein [Hyaloscypha finlandica]
MSGEFHPSTGILPPKVQPKYQTYKSPYGPKYTVQNNLRGWTFKSVSRLGMTLAGFGGVAGFFAVYFFSDVPRVRKDIWQKVPIIGQHYVKEVPASDNPF